MSLQNLLEMEEYSVEPPKPKPRPPRGKGGPPASSQASGKRERAIDDDDEDDGEGNYDKVMSISPLGRESPGGDVNAGAGKRVAFQRRSTGNSFDNEAFIGEGADEDDGDNSSATFTIENEKSSMSVPSVKVIKKPPIPKPKKRRSPEPSTPKSEPEQPTQIAKEDHLAVDIGGDDGEGEGKVEGEVDSDKGSVTSGSVMSGSKQSVKSRFGKLFKVSKKKSNDEGGVIGDGGGGDQVTTTPTGQSEATSGGSGGDSEKGRKGLFGNGRWKKTFTRSTSKPLPEEDEEGDEEKGKLEVEQEVKKKREKFSKKDERRRNENTRIFMPEETEDKLEPEVEEGGSSDEGEGQQRLKVEREKNVGAKRSPKFKPLAKLVIRKGKEKSGKKKGTPMTPPPPPKQVASGSSETSEEERGDPDAPTTSANEGQGESKSSPAKKRRQRRKSVAEIVVEDWRSGKDLLFGVTIHCSDLLPLDPNVIHPVVKVTVMYQNGKYMRKGGGGGGDSQMSPSNNGGGGGRSSKSRRRRRGGDEAEGDLEEDASGDTDRITTSNLAKAVLPIMTQPCQARQSIPTFAPTWNELLVFEEPFKRFTKNTGSQESQDKQPIVFFEIMDFLPMTAGPEVRSSSSNFHGSDPGWYKVCWGFLKPIGANGHLNLNRKLRLQLYKPVNLKKKLLPKQSASPEVYLWWKGGQREKVSTTLWVTPKGILPPETKSASLRQLLSMRKEQLTQAILDSQLAPKIEGRRGGRGHGPSASSDIYDDTPIWSRISGQSCKIPNKLVATLPSSQIESLNITISGNVHALRFSPCGNFLAAALDTDDLHVVLIFGVPSWKLLKTLKGHHGLVYELSWNILEDEKQNFCRHLLATASGDATCRIWKMEDGRVKTLKLFKVLYHPSYVYSAKWHPWRDYPMLESCLVATSCFDWVIRVWLIQPEVDKQEEEEIKKKKKRDTPSKLLRSQSHHHHDASPIILLDKHSSFVNCLLFDAEGHHMFSGDGTSCLLKWSCGRGLQARPPLKKNSWRLEKDVKLHSASIPINSLSLHPSGSRLLVHLRDNLLKILDVVTLIPLQSFPGLDNSSLQISSCFSPCGNLVLSGSEDATLLIWDADTGKILQIAPQPPKSTSSKNCYVACVDYHPFDFYVGVGICSKNISEPSPVLIHFYEAPTQTNKASIQMNYPILKKTAMKFRQSIEKEETGSSFQHHPPTKRVDSSEKFMTIIKKLDTALYFAQQRNKKRWREAASSNCLQYSVTSTDNPSKGEEEDLEGEGGNGEERPPRRYTQKRNKKEEKTRPAVMTRRPQSASQILEGSSSRSPSIPPRGRREAFRRSHSSGTKSDSEQSYQLKGQEDQREILEVGPPPPHPPKPLKRRSIHQL